MLIPLATWQDLISPGQQALVAAASLLEAKGGSADAAGIARLRRTASAHLVHAALELARARRKAASKWPANIAARLVADTTGVEMATSALAGAYKAEKFRRAGIQHVLDLCCGVGGDAMALTAAGLHVTTIDADPARAWMASINASCPSIALDIERGPLPTCSAFHLDPARRDEHTTADTPGVPSPGRRRLFDLHDHRPAPDAWVQVIRHAQACANAKQPFGGGAWGGAIKLGPGVDEPVVRAALAPALAPALAREHANGMPMTLEYLSERGRLTQAVCWLGVLADPRSRVIATRLDVGGLVASISDASAAPARTAPDASEFPASNPAAAKFLIEVDACVERAGLLHILAQQHGWQDLHPGLGLLTSDTPPGQVHAHATTSDTSSALWTAFEVLEFDTWNSRRIAQRLRQLGAGIVEVKTRGGACDPDAVQRELRGDGPAPLCVFVLRLREPGMARGGQTVAFITRRLPD